MLVKNLVSVGSIRDQLLIYILFESRLISNLRYFVKNFGLNGCWVGRLGLHCIWILHGFLVILMLLYFAAR